jgi:multimeric flavodoxin WrbA
MVSTILGICGSPRKAATLKALEIALEAAGEAGAGEVETELVFFKGRKISPCNHCNACKRNGGTCIIEDDMKPLYEKVLKASCSPLPSTP